MFHNNSTQLGKLLQCRAEYLSKNVLNIMLTPTIIAFAHYCSCGISRIWSQCWRVYHQKNIWNCRSCTELLSDSTLRINSSVCVIPYLLVNSSYGRSLGCVVASYLAAKYPSIAGLIVESPVSRISTVAGVFSCLLTRKQRETLRGLDCIDYLQNVTCPKLLIYGSLDHFNRRNSQKVETHSLLFI